ncbi:MAG: class I SAM-dependent methyltransferase [Deltaproteobacteria bacterium]|nr:class I SAM-dependent methyltransferase [Deltaproteobacteria bacterium]
MSSPRLPRARRTPQRYQLGKHALAAIDRGHPWVFRDHLSTAAAALVDGQWLALYDGQNQIIGHGIYDAEGAIGIRVMTRGPERPTAATFTTAIHAALAKRKALRVETDAFRAIHGESDGLPAVVVDVFGDTVVVQSYSAGTAALARFAGIVVARAVGAKHLVAKPAQRRVGQAGTVAPTRVLYGAPPPEELPFREGPFTFVARPLSGQKSGTFLDLRGLRLHLAAMPLAGKRVLNLFAYTGTLGRACEQAGAAQIYHVDRSASALELGAKVHVGDGAKHDWLIADVFEWLPALGRDVKFDLIIVDPPSMTSRVAQVPEVLANYRRLYQQVARHVAPGGMIAACCCTSRVTRSTFRTTVGSALGNAFALDHELGPEPDHPVAFPEADYLKLTIWRRRGKRPGDAPTDAPEPDAG